MTVFSEELGQSVRSLQRPMSKLRTEGRVRCVGERNMARYFPDAGQRSKSCSGLARLLDEARWRCSVEVGGQAPHEEVQDGSTLLGDHHAPRTK